MKDDVKQDLSDLVWNLLFHIEMKSHLYLVDFPVVTPEEVKVSERLCDRLWRIVTLQTKLYIWLINCCISESVSHFSFTLYSFVCFTLIKCCLTVCLKMLSRADVTMLNILAFNITETECSFKCLFRQSAPSILHFKMGNVTYFTFVAIHWKGEKVRIK